MKEEPRLVQLRAELVQRGMPPVYVERIVEELADHFNDLMEERRSMEANDPGETAGSLGTPTQLAQVLAAEHRRRTFFGRHPLVAFTVLPVLAVYCLWLVLLQLLVWGGLSYQRVGWITESPAGLLGLRVGWVVLWQLPIVITSLTVSHLGRACCGRCWRISSCAILAVMAGTTMTSVQLAQGSDPGRLWVGLGIPFWLPFFGIPLRSIGVSQLFQFAIPLTIGLWFSRQQLRLPVTILDGGRS